MNKTRNSNAELLRIVAMLFIIAHHLLVHGMNIWDNNTIDNVTLLSLDSAFYVGVNLFVLISGYYGIKFRIKKAFKIWLTCAIFGALGYFIHLYMDNAHIGRSVLYHTAFSISNMAPWYIQVYFYLMLFSPLLNRGLENLQKNTFVWILILQTTISVYFGWLWENEVNKTGYNLVNFIWIYSIGCYIRQYGIKLSNRYYYLIIWIVASIINSIFSIYLSCDKAYTYNNPLIVIASISFFMFAISFDFHSKLINTIATTCFGVYLIHENCYISPYIYGQKSSAYYSDNILYFILCVIAIFVICSITDYVVQKTIHKPIMKIYDYFKIKEPFCKEQG